MFSPYSGRIEDTLAHLLLQKNRGKRPPPFDSADTTPEVEDSPLKKVKLTLEADDVKPKRISAQGNSFPPSLKHPDTDHTFQQSTTRPLDPTQLTSRIPELA